MGSYLTIVNDTPDKWECELGSDDKAFEVFRMILSVVGTAAKIAFGLQGILGAEYAVAAMEFGEVGEALNIIGGVSKFGMDVGKSLSKELNSKGYITILPFQSHRYGRMTLSLWQQGTCVRTEILNTSDAVVHTLYMRPIFSGATADSNRNHTISYWLNKKGTELIFLKAQANVTMP